MSQEIQGSFGSEAMPLPWSKRFTHYTDDGRWVGELIAANKMVVCEYVFEADADLILARVNASIPAA